MWMLFVGSQAFSTQECVQLVTSRRVSVVLSGVCAQVWALPSTHFCLSFFLISSTIMSPMSLILWLSLCHSFPNLIPYSNKAKIGKPKLFGLSIFYIKKISFPLHISVIATIDFLYTLTLLSLNDTSCLIHHKKCIKKNVNAVHSPSIRNLKSDFPLLSLELILSTSLYYVPSSHPAS